MAERLGIHDPTVAAFTQVPIKVGQLSIQPAAMGHIMLLRKVCPGFESDVFSENEMVRALIVFSTPAGPELLALRALTPDQWQEREETFACSLMISDFNAAAQAIRTQIDNALAPIIPTGEEGQKKTGSAGGSAHSRRPLRSTKAQRPSGA